MLRSFGALLLASSAACAVSDSASEAGIVGGSDASINDNPWQISFRQNGGHFCGGSIINEEWVLTAQHCTAGLSANGLSVLAGSSNRHGVAGSQQRNVTTIVPFPGFVDTDQGKDVALLKLDEPLDLDAEGVRAIGLVTPELEAAGVTNPGVTARVTGWGTLESGGTGMPARLQSVDVPIVSLDVARQQYNSQLTEDQLAAGAGGRDSCQGDSGGPLTVSANGGRLLAGVVSWGQGCGDANFAGMYARVSHFATWVADNTGDNPPPPPPPPPPPDGADNQTGDLARNQMVEFGPYEVRPGTAFTASITGTGDADLYVRFGTRPTRSFYDCRPFTSTSNESCEKRVPFGQTQAFVMIHGYAASMYAYEARWYKPE